MTSGLNNALTPTRPRRTTWGLVILLLVIHWMLAVSSVRHKSTTFDEIAHATRGAAYLATGDFRLGPPHPPLAHYWAALPGLVTETTFPDVSDDPDWQASDPWKVGHKYFYECGNDLAGLLFRGRAMMALIGVALGLLVWVWSRRLFGPAGGLLSVGLYAFSPTMLAHSRLITTDLVAALFFLAAVGALWRVLHRVSVGTVLLSSLALAALLLSKTSALLILPMTAVLILVRLLSRQPTELVLRTVRRVESRWTQLGLWLAAAAVHVLVCVALIWAAYGFRYAALRQAEPGVDHLFTVARLPAEVTPWQHVIERAGAPGQIVDWARQHRLLPEAYLYGMAHTLGQAQFRAAFLRGETRYRGWWYFFPYCFAVKTPLPLLVLLATAGVVFVSRTRARHKTKLATAPARARAFVDSLYRTAPLWTLFAVYGAFAIASHLNIGHRHILPIYPVLFIFVGGAAAGLELSQWKSARGMIVAGLSLLFAAASLSIWPNYLAFFNSLVGGPGNGYKHLVDSSLDWGQDLPALKTWLDHDATTDSASPAADRPTVYLSYFGTGDPKHYGIEARSLPSYPPWQAARYASLTGGLYCISASTLQQMGLLAECHWTEALEAAYQDHRRRLDDMIARRRGSGDTVGSPRDLTAAEIGFLRQLRFGRLCAFLRRRPPDDQVGHSILIYRLSDDQVRRAVSEELPKAP
ncbi:MAG: glycosyltransferase family 39 protein, partial [Planctomycetes bacterium]|nr:glycosyltransferase family 39 protein [Planctomycetota bacterium]